MEPEMCCSASATSGMEMGSTNKRNPGELSNKLLEVRDLHCLSYIFIYTKDYITQSTSQNNSRSNKTQKVTVITLFCFLAKSLSPFPHPCFPCLFFKFI